MWICMRILNNIKSERNKLCSSVFLKEYIIKTDNIVSFKFYFWKGINTGWRKPKLTAVRQK